MSSIHEPLNGSPAKKHSNKYVLLGGLTIVLTGAILYLTNSSSQQT